MADFKYVRHKDINFTLWDECIGQSPNGTIYALSWYLNIVSPGWDGIIRESGQQYHEVFPLPHTKKFFFPILHRPIFSNELGLFNKDNDSSNPKEILEIIDRKYLVVRDLFLNSTNQIAFKFKKIEVKKVENFVIDLKQGYHSVYGNYSNNRKRDLKVASSFSLKVNELNDMERFIEVFTNTTAKKILGLEGENFEYPILRSLFKETYTRKMGRIFQVLDEKMDLLAAAYFLFYKNRIIYLIGCSTKTGREKKAMSWLIDETIKANPHYEIFDFAGSEIQDLATFFKRFGAKPIYFFKINKNSLPFYLKWMLTFRKRLKDSLHV